MLRLMLNHAKNNREIATNSATRTHDPVLRGRCGPATDRRFSRDVFQVHWPLPIKVTDVGTECGGMSAISCGVDPRVMANLSLSAGRGS